MPANPNHLLVEDQDTCGAVIGLMRQHIGGPDSLDEGPAFIEVRGSSGAVLNKKFLSVKMKESGLASLGLIVDADTDFLARWDTVKDVCRHLGGIPPEICPEDGLILDIGGRKLGVWIMPDNKSQGMLENFCHTLVPPEAKPLWEFARKCVDKAGTKKAPFNKEFHTDKAHIHTWLAWQDPPGERMGVAITKKILLHGSDSAQFFVCWFKTLFDI